jgi:hypothetical protein
MEIIGIILITIGATRIIAELFFEKKDIDSIILALLIIFLGLIIK